MKNIYLLRLLKIKKYYLYLAVFLNTGFLLYLLNFPQIISPFFTILGCGFITIVSLSRYFFYKKWFAEYDDLWASGHNENYRLFISTQFKRSSLLFVLWFCVLNILLNIVNDTQSLFAFLEISYLALVTSFVVFSTHKCFKSSRNEKNMEKAH